MPSTSATPLGARPTSCGASSQAGAVPYTRCITIALNKLLTAFSPKLTGPCLRTRWQALSLAPREGGAPQVKSCLSGAAAQNVRERAKRQALSPVRQIWTFGLREPRPLRAPVWRTDPARRGVAAYRAGLNVSVQERPEIRPERGSAVPAISILPCLSFGSGGWVNLFGQPNA